MKVLAIFTLVCIVWVEAVPNQSPQQALKLLAWAESKGGAIISEVILGKKTVNGRSVVHPMALTDYHSFLNELSTRLEELKATTTNLHARNSRSTHTTTEVVLPPDTSVQNLDFNDILDIIGDYTKGFMELVEPVLYMLEPIISSFFKRDVTQGAAAVQRILAQIEEMKTAV